MVGRNFLATARKRRECLRVGSSSLVLGAAGSLAMTGKASGFEMVADGRRFVRLEEGMFEIETGTQAALLTMEGGSIAVPADHYEILGNDVYLSKTFTQNELAQALSSTSPAFSLTPAFWMANTGVSVPLLGVAGASAFYLLQPGILRFDNAPTGLAYENDTPVTYTPMINRRDGEGLTYSLTGDGADDALFDIDVASGRLSFIDDQSYESPQDRNSDNIYSVDVQTSDGYQTATQTVSISLIDINEAPSWVSAEAATARENDGATSYIALGSDPDTNYSLSYSLSGDGPDDDLFSVDENTGVLRFRAAPDFEAPGDKDGNNAFVIQLVVSDGQETAKQDVTIVLSNVNEAPRLTSGASGSMDENGTTTTYRAAATDVDAGDTQTYSILIQGADDSFFSIDPTTGVVSLNGALDYENPSDQNGDGDYEFSIQVKDAAGAVDTLALSMTLEDLNEVPVFENAGPFSVRENATAGAAVGDSNASDGDAGTTDMNVTYSITGGTGLGLFDINATTGAITVKNSSTLDYETTASYTLEVTATDATNTALNTVQTYTIAITDQNEAPAFSSSNTLSIAEGATSPTLQANVTDPEGDGITWSIVGGADKALFSISSSGEININSAQDFETPTDGNGDNQHLVTVRADDGNGNQTDQELLITITDVNEAPVFTSGGSALQNENTTTAGYVAAAADAEGATLIFSIVGTGADDALFSIDPTTGSLSFIVAPDAETPGDANGQNDYEVNLQVTDGANTDEQAVTINISNVNEPPTYTSGNSHQALENSLSTSYLASGSDPEAGSLSFTLAGTGEDDILFTIDPNSGALSFLASPDFETPGSFDSDNVYELDIVVSDGILTDTESVTISVLNANEAPTLAGSTTTNMIEEQLTTGFSASATDIDAGDGLTYSLATSSGTNDNALLQIAPDTGAVSFLSNPDFEAPGSYLNSNVYTVDVVVTDNGGAQDAQTYFINVQDDGV